MSRNRAVFDFQTDGKLCDTVLLSDAQEYALGDGTHLSERVYARAVGQAFLYTDKILSLGHPLQPPNFEYN